MENMNFNEKNFYSNDQIHNLILFAFQPEAIEPIYLLENHPLS
jgi:hypothetical protein